MSLFLLLLANLFVAQADDKPWSRGTAHVLPRGRYEVGLFGPLRFGAKDGVEIELHPGWAILSPHAAIKLDVVEVAGWNLAYRQSLSYPTPLLRQLARAGTGGMITPDSLIPHIISSDSQLLMTRDIAKKHQLTWRFRTQLAGGFGDEQWVTIDAPIAYARTSVFHNHVALNSAIRFDGTIYKSLGYSFDSQLWLLPGNEANWAFEEMMQLSYRPSSRFSLQAGAFFVYGEYPYGTNWHLLPMFDLQFAWGTR